MFKLFLLTILAASLIVVSAQPIERAIPAPPAIYGKSGFLRVLGVGSTNRSYNQSAAFNGKEVLALGSSSVPFSLEVKSYSQRYEHAVGYIHQSAVTCLTAHTDSGATSFTGSTCADAATEGDIEDIRRRQTFSFTPGGNTISLVLGDADHGIPTRPNVRIVGGNEVHTTPDNNDHNMQLYLQT